jgi:hypothetical protein
LAYLDGEFPDYPDRILEATREHVQERLNLLKAEGNKPTTVDEDYLRNRNPVFHKALLQLTMGAPQPVYYGGLVMAQVRHFDARRERPGLPEGVAALVGDVSREGIELTLVNVGCENEELILQAGAYGEHRFESVATDEDDIKVREGKGDASMDGNRRSDGANTIRVYLPSGSRLSVTAALDRFVNDPSYALPWN